MDFTLWSVYSCSHLHHYTLDMNNRNCLRQNEYACELCLPVQTSKPNQTNGHLTPRQSSRQLNFKIGFPRAEKGRGHIHTSIHTWDFYDVAGNQIASSYSLYAWFVLPNHLGNLWLVFLQGFYGTLCIPLLFRGFCYFFKRQGGNQNEKSTLDFNTPGMRQFFF